LLRCRAEEERQEQDSMKDAPGSQLEYFALDEDYYSAKLLDDE
jgi:hypothetical protein